MALDPLSYVFFKDPDPKADPLDLNAVPHRPRHGDFNPIFWLIVLSLVGTAGLLIIRHVVPADFYNQWFYLGGVDEAQSQGANPISDVFIVVFSALFAVFCLTFYGFIRLLSARRRIDHERTLMESVLEGSQAARFICDERGNEVFSNRKFKNLLGVQDPVHLEGFEAFFNPPSPAYEPAGEKKGILFDLADKARHGEHHRIELPVVVDDDVLWYAVTVTALERKGDGHDFGRHGAKRYVHFRIDDITQRRTVEETLHQERQKLLDFMDNALVGFFSVDATGRFLFANSTLARWFGLDDQRDFSKYNLHDFLVTPPLNGAAFDIMEGGGAKQYGDVFFKSRKGNEFMGAIAHAVIYDENGAVRTQSVIRDLTPEREMKEALRRSEDRFHRFFEDAPNGILLVSKDGTIEEANTAFLEILGHEALDVVGKALISLVRKDDEAKIKALVRALDLDEDAAPIEIQLKNADETPLQVMATRLKGSKSFLFHFNDLSKQKQLEVQFTQSQKMQAVGQLAGGVAHDFNNLLTAMIGFCDLLLERHRAGDPSFHDIMQIKQNANRAASLVRQLLAFSRQQTLRPQILDMTDVLSELSSLLRRLIGANITLNMSHSRDVLQLKADHSQMEQVFINLVVNARDAMKEGGVIAIRSSLVDIEADTELVSDILPAGRWIKIDVEDQGHGIPDTIMTRIFDPFFTTKPMGEGTGLGLSTVYGIIRQTGGFLDVESEVGKGTVFSLYLPLASEDDIKKMATVEKEQAKTKDLTGSEKIMIVEDEEAVRKFSARALSAKGYEILEAEHGADALAIFETLEGDEPVQLVISDVMMPEMDGPTMAKILQEKYPTMKILFVSGFSEDRISDYAGDHIFFLPKPFSLKQLAEKVKEILGQ